MGSSALGLAYAACGRIDIYFHHHLSPWDVASGLLLVREAGGTVTDIVGGDGALETGDIVAAGASFHPTILEITRKAFA